MHIHQVVKRCSSLPLQFHIMRSVWYILESGSTTKLCPHHFVMCMQFSTGLFLHGGRHATKLPVHDFYRIHTTVHLR